MLGSSFKKVDIIIQARMGSTRLPGKVLLPFGEETVLDYVVRVAHQSKYVRLVLVATTTNTEDDKIEKLCRDKEYNWFRGSEEDVLGRYYHAATSLQSDVVVRLTGDNPFVNMEECDKMITLLLENSLDYTGNHDLGLPLGAGAEVFTYEALSHAYRDATQPYEREHVTPYLKEHPTLFRHMELVSHSYAKYSDIRLTLDTEEDYRLLCCIKEEFNDRIPTTQEIISFLDQHSTLKSINSHIMQKPIK